MNNQPLASFLQKLPWPENITATPLAIEEPFVELAARFAHQPGMVVLLSGGESDSARHHLLALFPWFTVTAKTGHVTLQSGDAVLNLTADPFAVQKEILAMGKKHSGNLPAGSPVCGGLFGYWAYDLKDHIEALPKTGVDDLLLPDLLLYAPAVVIVKDLRDGKITGYFHGDHRARARHLAKFERMAKQPPSTQAGFSADPDDLKANLSRQAYLRAVDRIKRYIRAGDIYQVNMSQRYDTPFRGDPFDLFQHLYRQNPAPFFAFINAGSHQVISTSPERYLKLDGAGVETRPIKGTHPRFDTPARDHASKAALEECPKNDAELSMIVDLLRNDLGKVCRVNSVQVGRHKKVEAYHNVYHLVSIITGVLEDRCDAVDLLRATFPGGSITGCPKVRAMEIIDELESCRRHVYTGAIGYCSFHDTMDLAIAIRTATLVDGHLYFSVGGGIVHDSDPAAEYEETLHKGRTLLQALKGAGRQDDRRQKVWFNGKLVPAAHAMVPATATGFQYGAGLFETLRVVNGKACFLNEHLQRMRRSWEMLFDMVWPDLDWREIIAQVIRANGLEQHIAAVKLLAAAGKESPPHALISLLVTARPYRHRLEALQVPGLAAGVYPHPRETPLVDHKTTNYLYYHLAAKWAKANGLDEAVILNADGTVSETNTANLLLIQGKTVVTPVSRHVLPGVMQQQVLRWLKKNGYSVKSKSVGVEDLQTAEAVWLTNSLLGTVPLLTLDGQQVRQKRLWEKLNTDLLQ